MASSYSNYITAMLLAVPRVKPSISSASAVCPKMWRKQTLPLDEHFNRRLEVLLDEAESSGDYVTATKDDFDAMEREALELMRGKRKS
jgi:hypothetical protein